MTVCAEENEEVDELGEEEDEEPPELYSGDVSSAVKLSSGTRREQSRSSLLSSGTRREQSRSSLLSSGAETRAVNMHCPVLYQTGEHSETHSVLTNVQGLFSESAQFCSLGHQYDAGASREELILPWLQSSRPLVVCPPLSLSPGSRLRFDAGASQEELILPWLRSSRPLVVCPPLSLSPPIGKINPFSKMTITFEPGFRQVLITMT